MQIALLFHDLRGGHRWASFNKGRTRIMRGAMSGEAWEAGESFRRGEDFHREFMDLPDWRGAQ